MTNSNLAEGARLRRAILRAVPFVSGDEKCDQSQGRDQSNL